MEIEKREIEKKGKRLMKGDTNRKKCQAPPKTGDEKPPNRFGGLKRKIFSNFHENKNFNFEIILAKSITYLAGQKNLKSPSQKTQKMFFSFASSSKQRTITF